MNGRRVKVKILAQAANVCGFGKFVDSQPNAIRFMRWKGRCPKLAARTKEILAGQKHKSPPPAKCFFSAACHIATVVPPTLPTRKFKTPSSAPRSISCASAPSESPWINSPNNPPMSSTHPNKLGKNCRVLRHHQLLPPVPSEIPFCRSHSGQADCASSLRGTRPSLRTLHRPVDRFFAKTYAKHPNKPTKPGKSCRILPQSLYRISRFNTCASLR